MSESEVKKAKKVHGVDYVLAIDVETTGSNLVKHWMPEFGATLWRVGATEPELSFYRCLEQPPGTDWCPTTCEQFWDNPAKGVGGVTPRQAMNERRSDPMNKIESPEKVMSDFVAWARHLERNRAKRGEVVIIITDTAAFDTAVMNYYLSVYCPTVCETLIMLFGKYRPTRDISAFYFGIGRSLKQHDSQDTALAALSLSFNDDVPEWVKAYKHNHDPLSDANSIGAMAAFILSKC